MIDVKQAVKTAILYFADLMEGKIKDIWLEEVEQSETSQDWRVTLSALAPTRQTTSNPVSAIAAALGTAQEERLFRDFTVTSDGKVKSMKIRNAK